MPKINYNKSFTAMCNGDKLPRKTKKHLLGKIISTAKLKRMLKDLELIEPSITMYEWPVFNVPYFCPKCGCTRLRSTGNMTSYPEHWEYFYCVRCNFKVGVIDNSPFIHCFEYKEFNYEIQF